MRVFLAGIVAAVLVVIPPSVSAGERSSGLAGRVLRGPVSPVCVTTRPCQVGASVILAFSRNGAVVAKVKSARSGDYRIALAPGSYTVSPALRAPLWQLSPRRVRVPAGRYARVNFLIDTGIR
jgi:hypothetical protein